MTTVKIPSSVTAIEERAFIECPLTSVYYDAENPIEGSESIFFGLYYSATLYVPACAVEKCMLIISWKYFYCIEAYEFDRIKDVDTDIDNNHPCDVYTLDGKKVATSTDDLAPGIYIIRQGDKAKKIAVQ